jgi:flagellar hook-basal body complex protein FliE
MSKEVKARKNRQLTRKEYEKLKRTAFEYVVIQGLDQKETAILLKLSEQTMSAWAREDKWKEQREARMQSSFTEVDNLRKLINSLSRQRLELEDDITDAIKAKDSKLESSLRKQAAGLSDEMSKLNKTLTNMDKGSYSLGTFIDIMDEVFSELREHDPELWEQTLEFQSIIVRKKTLLIG